MPRGTLSQVTAVVTPLIDRHITPVDATGLQLTTAVVGVGLILY